MSDEGQKHILLGYNIDVGELVETLARRWRLLCGVVGGALAIALMFLHLVHYTYTATLVVSPVASSADALSGKLGNLGGLASLAGINLGGQLGGQSFMLYQSGLYSRDVADDLSKKPEILHRAFPHQWDPEHNAWIQPSALYLAISGALKSFLGMPVRDWQPPDSASLQEYIADNVNLEADPQKPIVTITYRNEDPRFAVEFLDSLHTTVDEKLRHNALMRTNQYVRYLSEQLKTVTNADEHEALVTALNDQIKAEMMANVTASFAAQPFGQASASRNPTFPKPALVLLGALIAGILLGVLAAIWLPPLPWPARPVRAIFGRTSLHSGQ